MGMKNVYGVFWNVLQEVVAVVIWLHRMFSLIIPYMKYECKTIKLWYIFDEDEIVLGHHRVLSNLRQEFRHSWNVMRAEGSASIKRAVLFRPYRLLAVAIRSWIITGESKVVLERALLSAGGEACWHVITLVQRPAMALVVGWVLLQADAITVSADPMGGRCWAWVIFRALGLEIAWRCVVARFGCVRRGCIDGLTCRFDFRRDEGIFRTFSLLNEDTHFRLCLIFLSDFCCY